MAVRIITDSGLDLPGEPDPRLTIIPLAITFGTTTYADGVDLTNDRFYELLIESDELPKTSQATPYEYAQVFDEVRAAGDEAVVVTLSSALSGTYQSAVTAAADYEGIYVVDSLNVTIGQGVLVQYALRLSWRARRAAATACISRIAVFVRWSIMRWKAIFFRALRKITAVRFTVACWISCFICCMRIMQIPLGS